MSDGDIVANSELLMEPSSTDVFSGTDARLFDGYVNSLQQEIAASYRSEHLSPARLSPLRRSPRLSKAAEVSLAADDTETSRGEAAGIEDEEILGPSRPLTPETEGLIQDEPTSVLASRIMRAHDNPSPPPQSPEILNLPTLSLPFPLTPSNESSNITNTHSISTPISELLEDVYQSSISSSFPSNNLETPTKSRPLNNISDVSVEALAISSATKLQPNVSSIVTADSVPADTLDEQAVADALVLSADEAETVNLKSAYTIPSIDTQADESSHQPLRRSTRPRRSTARYLSPMRTEDLEFDPSETDESGPSNETKNDVETKITSPRRRTITLAANNAQTSEPLLFNDQPRSRSPTRNLTSKTRRELGSLSPGSSTILKSLLPAAYPLREELETEPASTQPPSEALSTPVRPTPPVRFTSPTRKTSPIKLQFQMTDLHNLNRTPARRIPIQAAVANGQMSAQQAARLLSNSSTAASSRPVFNIPSTDSPMRRVLLHDGNPNSSPTKRLPGSPVRSLSVEPKPVEPVRLKKRSESVEPVLQKTQGKILRKASPFSRSHFVESVPLPLNSNLSLHPTIPEEGPSTGVENLQRPAARVGQVSAEKSHFKQTTSRIPRIGLKPYARPPVSSALKRQEKTVNTRMVDSSKPHSSVIKPQTFNSRSHIPSNIPVSSPAKRVPIPSTPTSLKRKRSPSETISPTKSTPVVLLSRRLPGPSSSPAKKPPATQLRMVSESDNVLPIRSSAGYLGLPGTEGLKTAIEPSSSEVDTTTAHPLATLRMVSKSDGILPDRSTVISTPPRVPVIVEQTSSVPSLPSLPTPSQSAVVSSSPAPVAADPSPDTVPDSFTPAEPQIPSPADTADLTFRRTTRSNSNGTVPTKPINSSRPPPARRKNIPMFIDTGPFSGMTAQALRTLTESNTTKNKEYATVLLQTEVIRREGARPESPGMNVKSISQKEKEAKTRERSDRAERRAKHENSESKEDEHGVSEDEDRENARGGLIKSKHAWGSGDEEEYGTPAQHMKRLRPNEEVLEEEEYDKKRVKWDRGLCKEIYLDEIQPRTSHARIPQESVKKGCLAHTGKARPLDNLGNLPNAESPLKDMQPENIVVKKFVYDNDVVEPVAPAPAPVKTRSKSKKSRQ
ncbi:hypothetical protein DFJ43DRAFT_1117774 [Lentinula guzmanii]|uniref:Uncharacterized protein n=1 Tax=Lentinula guzmanii TaxID=2804957 RepID=A0AA38JHS1_9AGAR|nr:hypothetical protein DFJ43DRAFT_1117774 [Lentinula guzmanii]